MILDRQTELMDKQVIGSATTQYSNNAIDLGNYNEFNSDGTMQNQGRIVGYPSKTDAGITTDDFAGRYKIAHKLGSTMLPFFGLVTTEISRTGMTVFAVDFLVADDVTTAAPASSGPLAPATGNVTGATNEEVVATINLPIVVGTSPASNKIAKGIQIPWPSIPRYLTKRWFLLRFRITGGTTTTGAMSAGFTPHIASELG